MARFKYKQGHPCYVEESDPDISCEGGCPAGQVCIDGRCQDDPSLVDGEQGLTAADSLLDSFFEEGSPFDYASEDSLPFPNEQITFEEEGVQFATRDKIVANQGCAYWIWDSPAARFNSDGLVNTPLERYFGPRWNDPTAPGRPNDPPINGYGVSNLNFWGFPGQSAIFQDPLNTMQRHFYDPLRWSLGKVWTHRLTPDSLPGDEPQFVFPSTFSESEYDEKYFVKRVTPTAGATPPRMFYDDADGRLYIEEYIPIQWGGNLFGTMGEYTLSRRPTRLDFFKKMFLGTDSKDWTVEPVTYEWPPDSGDFFETGQVIPKTAKTVKEMLLGDAPKVNETLEAKFFAKGILGERTKKDVVAGVFADVPKTYLDLVHKVEMPFFEKETGKMNIDHNLSADIIVHRNFFSERFKRTNEGDSEKIFDIPNCYRYYRERKRPNLDCELDSVDQVDRILKFAASNIKEMNEVTEDYKKAFPVTAQIRFDTTQKNDISDLFVRYGMDKYLLDQREKYWSKADALSPDIHRVGHDSMGYLHSGLIGTGDEALREYGGQEEFFYSYDIGKYSIFHVKTYAEYLNQISTKTDGRDFAETDNYMKTVQRTRYAPLGATPKEIDNRAFNMSTEMRTAYLDDFLYQYQGQPGSLGELQYYWDFDDNMFPLGVLPKTRRDDDDTMEWSTLVSDFKREIFAAKMTSMPFENKTNIQNGQLAVSNRYIRTFDEILQGRKAYSEVLGYAIEKYEHTSNNLKKLVQKFYFFDSSDVREINFLDNQLRYNKKYTYVIKAINCVFGSEYYYALDGRAKFLDQDNVLQDEDPTYGSDLDFIDEYLYNVDQGDVEERNFRFERAFHSSRSKWSKQVAQIKVRSTPKVAFIEVPYFKKVIHTIDLPPMPPQVEILPYKGDRTRVLLNVTPSSGGMEAIPEAIIEEDAAVIDMMYMSQDVQLYTNGGKSFDPQGPIKYSGDSLPSEYEVFILENPKSPPIDYSRFSDGQVKRYGNLTAGNLHEDFYLKSNIPYYMFFRAVDDAGVSVPSDVYYMQLVSNDDGMYLVVEEYIFPEPTPILTKKVQNGIQFQPSSQQIQRLTSENPDDISGDADIWDKEYRINIKSNTTGRELNVDFSYNIVSIEDSPPAIGFIGDPELDEILRTCNRFTTMPQNRKNSELYRAPSELDTGPVDSVRVCNSTISSNVSFFDPIEKLPGANDVNALQELTLPGPTRNSVRAIRNTTNLLPPNSRVGEARNCGCPPGYIPLSEIKGAGDIVNADLDAALRGVSQSGEGAGAFLTPSRSINDFKACVQASCPEGSILQVDYEQDTGARTARLVLHCKCTGSREACNGNCLQPCPPEEVRNADCQCEARCTGLKFWNGSSCSCPAGYIDRDGECIRQDPAPKPTAQKQIDDERFDILKEEPNILTEDKIDELQKLGHLTDEVVELMNGAIADIDTVLEQKNKALEDSGLDDPRRPSGDGTIINPGPDEFSEFDAERPKGQPLSGSPLVTNPQRGDDDNKSPQRGSALDDAAEGKGRNAISTVQTPATPSSTTISQDSRTNNFNSARNTGPLSDGKPPSGGNTGYF